MSALRTLWLLAFAFGITKANAQLPNEKFGKPSAMEWEFVGWGDAIHDDAVILCKTMKATYQLTDQVSNYNESFSNLDARNLSDFSKNDIDDSNILINYEYRLRTKILKPEGASHANIDITYFSVNDKKKILADELSDLKVRVFTKNEKGKVEKRTVNTDAFVKERVDDNYEVLHVLVPDVQAGSIIEYQYNIISIRPAFLYDWVFQESIPTVRSACDIEIPAFLQFKMNVPINKLIQSGVEVGHLSYDTNRADMKKAKTCVTNHYKIVGEYIPAEGETIANFTSQILSPSVTPPASMPEGSTHLKVK